MKIIGLTGSIGMGKSTVANMFKKHDVPTISSDQIVHDLYQNEAVELLKPHFPNAIIENKVDRKELSKYILNNAAAFKTLEALIHPLVYQKQEDFFQHHRQRNTNLVLLDIPLLFETNAQDRFDYIIVVSCDFEMQKQRVLARPQMSEEKFEAILEKQMPDAEKRALADYVVDTSKSLEQTEKQVVQLINFMQQS